MSEDGEVRKLAEEEYYATCCICKRTDNLSLWPHRVRGLMVGFVFACPDCNSKVPGLYIWIGGRPGDEKEGDDE